MTFLEDGFTQLTLLQLPVPSGQQSIIVVSLQKPAPLQIPVPQSDDFEQGLFNTDFVFVKVKFFGYRILKSGESGVETK